MAKIVYSSKDSVGGMSDFPKDAVIPNSFYISQSIDYRTDPQAITLLPAALKESGSKVTDLLKSADTVPSDLSTYLDGSSGNIYKRTIGGSWSLLRTVAESHGNGIGYFTGDDYLYYASDKVLGRYGPLSGTPNFTDDFLGAQGGVPLNTASLLLASASSMYGSAADSATLSITGDLTLETFFKANSLPTAGNSMTLIGKWDESGATRSYKLDLFGVSGYFGNGSDGALTISVDTTESVADSACTGTSGSQLLTATNAAFAAGQIVLIHQTQGTGAGQWERNTINGYTAGTITLGTPLVNSYTTGAQVRKLFQYTDVTVNAGVTWTAKAWNGTTGGILAFLVSGTFTGTSTGTISGIGKGFTGGASTSTDGARGHQGEGTAGAGGSLTYANNGNGGGGGDLTTGGARYGGGGGGGGNGNVGTVGNPSFGSTSGTGTPAYGGAQVGSSDLTSLCLGGGGGGGSSQGSASGSGGIGGAIIFITATTFTNASTIVSGGTVGSSSGTFSGGGGGGAGGSILIKSQVGTLGTDLITASGAAGGTGTIPGYNNGGAGADGRIHLDYYTSYTGTTTPTLTFAQDNSLVTTTTTQTRLSISNDGTSFENLTMNLSTLTTGVWNRLSVTWAAASSLATFYLNAVSLGTFTGTKTAIHDNTSLLYVGANKGASTVGNFFDGLLNDMRVWNNVQTAGQIYTNDLIQVANGSGGLNAYWKFNSAYTDSTANTNTITAHGSPTFSSDVPFSAPTTRLDIDQSYTTTGDTYAVPTTISEASTDMHSFTPTLDPQKSIDINIAAKGTGDWTVYIHDVQNRLIASATITNANLPTSGYVEFIFSTPWRIVINKNYHYHVTSTVADGTIVASSHNDLSKGDFHTYYGFLVTDTQYHPIVPFLNKMIIGNERYLATWDGAFYNANFITFPPQTHVRCFAFWREYIAIATWREATTGTPNIYDWTVGKIYFWDGISLTFNFWVDVPEGQINAMVGDNNILYMMAGYKGDLLKYEGSYSTLSTSGTKLKRVPLQKPSDYMEIYPGAMTMWRSLVHVGLAAVTNSTTVMRGAYSWGTLNQRYEESLSLDYPISTGNITSSVKIGLVYPVGQTLLIGWQDGSGFGCDQVNFTNNTYATYGQIQTLIQDNNSVWKEKMPLVLKADHLPLNSGESMKVGYKLDRGSWTSGVLNSTLGSPVTQEQISDGRSREVQYKTELYSTGTTSPTLLGVSAWEDDLTEEQQFN